jgi:ribosomal-protein-alanine N-acetyltransferase
VKWWTYLPIHVWKNAVIGSCGFKGPPDSDGMVELGYEVIEQYRNRGYAREITHILINLAFKDDSVKKVRAHTLATSNPSASLLEKCGFKKIDEVQDEEDGPMWRWERLRDDSVKK